MKKNDKLKKHHFWILAGLAPLLALLTMVFLMTGPGSAKDKAAEEIKKNLESAKGTNPPGNRKLEKDFPDQMTTLNERREILWKANYEAQKSIFEWPQSPRLTDLERRYTKFGAKMVTNHNLAFDDFKKSEVYEAAYDRAAEQIKPTVFPGGSWKRVLRYVSNWTQKYPTSDEIWLALEDLWVQKGLLLPVKEINAAAAQYELVKAGADGKPGDPPPLKRTFQNRIWKLELEVPTTGPNANKAILAKLTNRTNRIQLLGTNNEMRLDIWLSENAPGPMRYRIQKDYAKAHETIEVKNPIPNLHTIPSGVEVQSIARVEQVLDERTVPVRQVLNVELGYKDARHFPAVLKPPTWWPPDATAGTDATGAGGFGSPMMGSPMMPPGGEAGSPDGGAGLPGGPMMGMPGMGGASRSAKVGTPMGVLDGHKNRYVDVTDQVRRMPVGVVLLVDQMFIQDALVAYANSPLRFQITQYHWKRFRGKLSDTSSMMGGSPGFGGPDDMGMGSPGAGSPDGMDMGSPDGAPSEGSFALPGKGGLMGGMMPGGEGGYGGMMPGGYGMPGMMGGGTSGSLSEGQITSGLVELTLYGIVTLYEKYEVKPADGTAAPGAATPDAATPAPAGTPGTPEATTPMPTEPKAETPTAPVAPTNPMTPAPTNPMTNPMTPAPPAGTPPAEGTPAAPPKK